MIQLIELVEEPDKVYKSYLEKMNSRSKLCLIDMTYDYYYEKTIYLLSKLLMYLKQEGEIIDQSYIIRVKNELISNFSNYYKYVDFDTPHVEKWLRVDFHKFGSINHKRENYSDYIEWIKDNLVGLMISIKRKPRSL